MSNNIIVKSSKFPPLQKRRGYEALKQLENIELPKKFTCSHEWKTYNGFIETYDFCTKCDVKR